jgi:hypothetical protein
MSYEFNPESQTLELPNPYKVENLALFVSAGVSFAAGVNALFMVKDPLLHDFSVKAGVATCIAIALLTLGISLAVRGLRQLKFFFGRNRPESLAPVLSPGVAGDSPLADHYKETLRHNALIFDEPKGPLNGLLYSWLPQLIYSPAVIQQAAQRQFQNFLGLGTIFVSFLLCWALVGGTPASAWIGLVYAVLAYHYIGPLRQSTLQLSPVSPSGELGSQGLVWMVVLCILGPVAFSLVATKLPDIGGLTVNAVVILAMLLAMGAIALFIMALRKQLGVAPQEVGAARVLETVTMNAHPNKLMEELDRVLMNEWFSQIPNRRYTQKLPQVSGRQGQFAAEILDETQPQPKPNCTATDLRHALNEPYFRWLSYLTAMSMACLVIGAIVFLLVVHWILQGEAFGSSLALALSFVSVGLFAQQSSHELWGRFDFVSKLIWVELVGSYESAQVHIGNQFTGNVQTAKSVINIEAMTLRVWVSEIETVIFGKDASRQLIRMRGLPDKAQDISAVLKQFGESRSMVVAPTSASDLARAQRIGEVNQLVAGGSTPQSLLPQQVAMVLATTVKTTCAKCVAPLDAAAKFCGACGTPAGQAAFSD